MEVSAEGLSHVSLVTPSLISFLWTNLIGFVVFAHFLLLGVDCPPHRSWQEKVRMWGPGLCELL